MPDVHIACHATAIPLAERNLAQEMACRPLAAHVLMEKMTILTDVEQGRGNRRRNFFKFTRATSKLVIVGGSPMLSLSRALQNQWQPGGRVATGKDGRSGKVRFQAMMASLGPIPRLGRAGTAASL